MLLLTAHHEALKALNCQTRIHFFKHARTVTRVLPKRTKDPYHRWMINAPFKMERGRRRTWVLHFDGG